MGNSSLYFNCIFPRCLQIFVFFCKKSFLKSLSLFVERQMKENIFEDILPVACSFSFTFPTSVQCLGSLGKGGWDQGLAMRPPAQHGARGQQLLQADSSWLACPQPRGVRGHWASCSWDSDHVTSATESLHSMTFA